MTSDSSIRIEAKGYNRGLILGLTMAESMLLLVFCLLLVAGAVIAGEKAKAIKAETRAATVESKLSAERMRAANSERDLRTKLALAEPQKGETPEQKAKREKEWRELVRARQIVEDLMKKGITEQDIAKFAAAAEALSKAKIDIADAQKIVDDLRELARMREKVAALDQAVDDLNKSKAKLEAAKAAVEARVMELSLANKAFEDTAASSKPHDWPPIISLSEAEGYSFKVGSAELTTEFSEKLDGKFADEIKHNLDLYDVDIIEVIGHTDEQPISRTGSNFDKTIADVLALRKPITSIVPADNAGLGLARAVSVANILRANPKLNKATVIPLSAAQLVLPGDTLTTGQGGDIKTRRRIEIRIRRREQAQAD